MSKRRQIQRLLAVALSLCALVAWRISLRASATNAVWNAGDVIAGVGNGTYNIYTPTGTLKDSISDPTQLANFTTGCAFNNDFTKLYTTYFNTNNVVVYDGAPNHDILQRINTTPPDTTAQNESLVFAADGSFFVGHAGAGVPGSFAIQKYNAAGVWQASYNAANESRGTDWLDLAANQTTIFYTSEGKFVKRFDTSGTGTQLSNFNAVPLPGDVAYALRLLPPGDGSGGALVADKQSIVRLNGAGAVVQTYDAPGEDLWFALNRDPDGHTFWSGDIATGHIYRFEIDGPAGPGGYTLPVGPPINTGAAGLLAGLCIKGELTAPNPAGPAFVIGDQEPHAVGNVVNFWGSQWWKNNAMSGVVSSGSEAFKGFAIRSDNVCGGVWSTDPGNSPPPPATIPADLTIVVTDSVIKNGSNISGTIKQLVVVHQDGHYGPNPGHDGNGTVTSVINCR